MPKFHLYVIHTAHLVHRQTRLHGTIQTIREIASAKGYEFRSNFVLTPDVGPLQAKVQQLSERIKYEKTGVPELDGAITVLNLEQISNYEKHREAWRRIQRECASEDVCVVIEDDAIMLPEFNQHLQSFIEQPYKDDWDFRSLSVSVQTDRRLQKISDIMRPIISKCAYALRPSSNITSILLDETETIRFTMRYQLSYIFLKRNVNAVVSNQQCIMEGSKLGLYPSTIHPNNVLIFNQEFMELYKMAQLPNPPLDAASKIYDLVKHIQNPDILHVYGIILFKGNKVKEASECFALAVEWMQKQHGLVTPQSDLLNNSINVYEHIQWDLPECLSAASKYDSILTQKPLPQQG